MKLKARQHVDHPRYGPGTTLEDGGKRTMVYFRNVGIRKFPTCSGRVALIVGQARLTKRLPLKTQQGNFCGQIGDWRNSPAKCCDSIKYLSSPRAEVVENRPCVRVHPPAQGGRTGVGD